MRQRSRRRRRRRIWLALHATLALSLGFLFVIMGLTGSLTLFAPTPERWLHPELTVENGTGVQRSPDELLAAARSAHPQRLGAWTLQLPQSPEDVAVAWSDGDTETRRGDSRRLLVAIDPHTAEVRISRYWGETAATWIHDLHSRLLLGEAGRHAVGFLGLALLTSVCTGLRLWLPSRHRIRQAFTLNPRAGFKRKVFDLHRVFGIYSAAILIVAALSGFHLVFPGILETVLDAEGVDHHDGPSGREIQSSAQPIGDPVNLAQAILMARGLFPSAQVHSITVPSSSRGAYRVDFLRPGEDRALTSVWVDRYSGQIRHVENSADFDRRQRFLTALPSLHGGRSFGLPGQCLWFLAGLTPLGLYATGWVHRLHKGKRRMSTPRVSLPEPWIRLWRQYLPEVPILWLRITRRIGPQLQRLLNSLRDRVPWR